MEDPGSLEKARSSRWGYLNLERGRVLCVHVSRDKVVLVEPDGGYFFPMPGEVKYIPMPDERTLVSAITGVKFEDLESLSTFCSEPRTMQEIEGQFPGVRAWRLRKLGLLRDTGRRDRRIVSTWAGCDLIELLDFIFGLVDVPTRNNNNPAR